MKRLIALLAAVVLSLGFAAPTFAADETMTRSGRVLIGIGGDVSLPAGDQADVVLVVNGDALVEGTANDVVVIDGRATISGATLGSLVVISGSATVTDSEVRGDIRTLDSQVAQINVQVGGTVRGLEEDMVALAWFVGVGALLVWLGVGLATLVAGMFLAGLAGRQVRATAALIRRRPGATVALGLAGIVGTPLLVGILAMTVVGLPLAFGMLFLVWPALAFLGYLVAAVWVGEWLLKVFRGRADEAERPYLATFLGLVAVFVVGFVPLVTAILSFLGFGAVLLAAWETLRGRATVGQLTRTSPAPVAG